MALPAPIPLSATQMAVAGLPAAGSAEPMPGRNRGPGLRTKDVAVGNLLGRPTRDRNIIRLGHRDLAGFRSGPARTERSRIQPDPSRGVTGRSDSAG